MVGKAAEHGFGEFRAHLDTMDDVADHYDFNDHAYLRFVEKIKDAVDPHGHPLARQAGHLAAPLARIEQRQGISPTHHAPSSGWRRKLS